MNRSITRTALAMLLALTLVGALAPVGNADVAANTTCENLEEKKEGSDVNPNFAGYVMAGHDDADRTSATWILYQFLDGQSSQAQDLLNGLDAQVFDFECDAPAESYTFSLCELDRGSSEIQLLPPFQEPVFEITFFEFDGDRLSYEPVEPAGKCAGSNDFPDLTGEIPEGAHYAVVTLDQGTPIGVQTSNLANVVYATQVGLYTRLA